MKREDIIATAKKLKDDEGVLYILFVKDCYSEEEKEDAEGFSTQIEKYKGRYFSKEYQAWYSKALLIIKDIFPERYEEFVSQYLPDKKRKKLDLINYTLYDAIYGLSVRNTSLRPRSSESRLTTQFNILNSAILIIDDRLDEIKGSLETEISEKEIESAISLYSNGYLRAAGAICGVLLEKRLGSMAQSKGLKVGKKDPTINDLNALLYKNGIVDSTQNKYLLYLGDIRNKCDHNKKIEPTKDEVLDLINGTKKVIQTY